MAADVESNLDANAEEEGVPSGPRQVGQGIKGQYVYWITMAHPTDVTIERLGLHAPTDYTREKFSELTMKAHADVEVEIMETVVCVERSAPTAQSWA